MKTDFDTTKERYNSQKTEIYFLPFLKTYYFLLMPKQISNGSQLEVPGGPVIGDGCRIGSSTSCDHCAGRRRSWNGGQYFGIRPEGGS
jgi:hypothetical protein